MSFQETDATKLAKTLVTHRRNLGAKSIMSCGGLIALIPALIWLIFSENNVIFRGINLILITLQHEPNPSVSSKLALIGILAAIPICLCGVILWWRTKRTYTKTKLLVLGSKGMKEEVENTLISMLGRDARESQNILGALGDVGSKNGTTVVVTFLDDPSSEVRKEAAQTLGKLGWSPTTQKERSRYIRAYGLKDNQIL